MPRQCYLLPVDKGGRRVLIGKKNLYGTRSKGKKVDTPFLWNNAGQWVISGGKSDGGESLEQAACREFYEETGVDLSGRADRSRSIFPDKYYGCLFVVVDDPDGLAAQITDNIVSEQVTDDELEQVEWVDIATAIQRMQVDLAVEESAKAMAHKPRDWFVIILQRLHALFEYLP